MEKYFGSAANPPMGICYQMILRIPVLIFIIVFFVLLLSFPYFFLSSDSAITGFMGEDIIKYGYLPTYFYGQGYLLSFTPYLYALIKLIFPAISPPLILRLVGLIVSFAGVLLFYEALLLMQSLNKRPLLPSAIIFTILLLSFPNYILSFCDTSSQEQNIFCFGALMFFITKIIYDLIYNNGKSNILWFFLGCVLLYSHMARPNAFIFGATFFLLLPGEQLFKTNNLKAKRIKYFFLGAAVGYLPAILHVIFRGIKWPTPFGGPSILDLYIGKDVIRAFNIVFMQILPHLFGMHFDFRISSFACPIFVITTIFGGVQHFSVDFSLAYRYIINSAKENILKVMNPIIKVSAHYCPSFIFNLIYYVSLFIIIIYIPILGYYFINGAFDFYFWDYRIYMSNTIKPLKILIVAFAAFMYSSMVIALSESKLPLLTTRFKFVRREKSLDPLWIGTNFDISQIDMAKYLGLAIFDSILIIGITINILLMLFIEGLTIDIGCARYLVNVIPIFAALYCRAYITDAQKLIIPSIIAVVLLFSSLPLWKMKMDSIMGSRMEERQIENLTKELIKYDGVIFADYWDAYKLGFVTAGKLQIEAFPWSVVRRYGAIDMDSIIRKSAWLVRKKEIKKFYAEMEKEKLYTNSFNITSIYDTNYLLIEVKDPYVAIRFMHQHHPSYFTSQYPPGI